MIATTSQASRALRWSLALAVAMSLAACSKDEPAETPAAPAAPVQPAGPTAEEIAAREAAEQALANLSAEELRTRGSQALREQRLYAPAGDSAMEYYLALRSKSDQPDASAESALIDLMPYAIIAAEQAISREDFAEAERLLELIEKTDAQTPALPRIRDSIASGQAAAADRIVQDAAREEQRARDAQPVTPPPAPAAPPPPPRPTTPVGVRTPQPSYPRAAIRAGVTGEVTVEISIAANGSVSDVRVVRAQPRGEFEREVLSTVRGWQFEPMDAPATLTRTFTFRP